MDSCCQDKACELEALRVHQSKTLWIVLGINAGMFGVEVFAGLIAGSTALVADSLDMLGDALVYGFSLYVVRRSDHWRAGVALSKGVIMALFGIMVLVQVGYQFTWGIVPDSGLMGAIGTLALAANLSCLLLLTRHRNDDLNMSSTWLCSRNDIIANVAVLAAAVAVFATGSLWPDLAVGLLITAVFMRSAVYVVRQAVAQLKIPVDRGTTQGNSLPVVLLLGPGECPCPAGACSCSIS